MTADEIIEPVAQMTLAMILALAKNFTLHVGDFREGLWKKHTGHSLSELTIGLIGFGRIARRLQKYLGPFGPSILVCDPFLDPKLLPAGVKACDLDTLLKTADMVSLHVSRSSKEGPILGANEFAKMKRGSFLVNTARGYLVDEKELEEALKTGLLAGAALDVFAEEPYHGPLADMPNVLCTPHVATLTRASRAAMEFRSAQNIVQFFERMHQK